MRYVTIEIPNIQAVVKTRKVADPDIMISVPPATDLSQRDTGWQGGMTGLQGIEEGVRGWRREAKGGIRVTAITNASLNHGGPSTGETYHWQTTKNIR